MKHIARHFLNQYSAEEFEEIQKGHKLDEYTRGEGSKDLNKRKITKSTVAYMHTVGNYYVKGFPYKVNGHTYTFPEPNPTLIYFSNAQRFRREIEEFRVKLLPKLNMTTEQIEDFTHEYFNYFGAVCGTVIFLFTSLESFMNSLLKETDTYIRPLSNKTEIFNFSQIQEGISFGEKIKTTIPQLTGKDYFKAHPTKAQLIDNLKEFRDNIIHTKTTTDVIQHDYVIKRSFSFKYDETIQVIAEYMNFYKVNCIKECDCGSDF